MFAFFAAAAIIYYLLCHAPRSDASGRLAAAAAALFSYDFVHYFLFDFFTQNLQLLGINTSPFILCSGRYARVHFIFTY